MLRNKKADNLAKAAYLDFELALVQSSNQVDLVGHHRRFEHDNTLLTCRGISVWLLFGLF